jgi:hypothetical protein
VTNKEHQRNIKRIIKAVESRDVLLFKMGMLVKVSQAQSQTSQKIVQWSEATIAVGP